jgi:hypothetical protein
MRFPASNDISSLYDNEYESYWPMAQLVNRNQHSWYGFSDFVIEDEFPILKLFSTQWERDFDGFGTWAQYLRVTWLVPVIVSILYVLAIPLGQRWMENRKAYELRTPLFLWNLLLSVFSIMGVIHLLPHFLYGLYLNGPMYFICRNAYIGHGRGVVGFWSLLFVLSKYAELIDTLFLVLRKKPVPFLHSFHHATVLLISIGTMMIYGPAGVIMLAVNYFVHAIMYTYYAIAAVTKPPSWGQTVTILQIAQMVNGLVMSGGIWYGAKYVENCEGQPINGYGIVFIYASYLVLFVQFYINRYIKKSSLKKTE